MHTHTHIPPCFPCPLHRPQDVFDNPNTYGICSTTPAGKELIKKHAAAFTTILEELSDPLGSGVTHGSYEPAETSALLRSTEELTVLPPIRPVDPGEANEDMQYSYEQYLEDYAEMKRAAGGDDEDEEAEDGETDDE